MASRSLDDLTPKAKAKCEAFLAAANAVLALTGKGLEVFVSCTYRSQAEQNELYASGRTKPGKLLTRTRHSKHTLRVAWDVAFRHIGKKDAVWNGPWPALGAIAKKLGITWGGNAWKKADGSGFVDLPHFQI